MSIEELRREYALTKKTSEKLYDEVWSLKADVAMQNEKLNDANQWAKEIEGDLRKQVRDAN